jgi:2'-5' RNA ligase
VTLFAGPTLSGASEVALGTAVVGLSLTLQIGALMLFGPHRGRFVLVHQVVPDRGLLELQSTVAAACDADRAGYFGPGRWSPHLTVARRVPAVDLPAMLTVLAGASAVGREVRITRCRRWDSDARRSWLI